MTKLCTFTDTELLACYVGAGQAMDGSVESNAEAQRQEAFRLLVLRHGRIVMSACRSVLHSAADAEDAFQATFFVLARKAGSIERGASLAAWLHRAALRIAIRAAKRNRTKQIRERRAQPLETLPDQSGESLERVSSQDRLGALHEAIGKLPEPLRSTVLLTYFEGLTRAQTADRLGVTEHVIHGRLKKARGQLRRMLARNCVPLAAVAILVQQSMCGAAQASVLRLANCCAQTVSHVHAGLVASANASAISQILAQGVIRTMTMNTAIRHASVFLLVAFCGWLVFGPTAPGGGNAMATAGLADLPVASGIEDQSLPATSFVSGMSQGQQSSQGGAARSLTEEQRKKLQELQPQTLEEMEETLRAAKKAFGLTKIRQLCIATHKFHEVHAALPPGNFPRSKDEANRPLLSWRVYLLPYLGDEAKELFEKFKLDEPWDSEHNKQLIPEMPEFYALNGKLRTGMSDVQAPFGADTLLGDETNTTFAQVTDGVSLTAMFFEVGPSHAVPWTKPDDFAFDLDATDAMQRFGQEDSDEFIVGWADGGVSVLPKTTTTEFMQSIIMCTDGSPKTLAETGR